MEQWCRQMDLWWKIIMCYFGETQHLQWNSIFRQTQNIRTLFRLCFYCPRLCVYKLLLPSWWYSLLLQSSRQNQLNGAKMTQQQRSTDKMRSTETCWLFLLQTFKTQLSRSFFYLVQLFLFILFSSSIHQQVLQYNETKEKFMYHIKLDDGEKKAWSLQQI